MIGISLSHWGIIQITPEQQKAWAYAMFWEGLCGMPRGSFRGEHNGTPFFEVAEI